jgi:hypothetical protein
VGVAVARRQPANPIGWIFLVMAVACTMGNDASAYAVLAYRLGHHLPLGPVAVLAGLYWAPMIAVFPVTILLFPDGALPSRRWRWVLGGRFNRARYDADQTIATFAGRLQDAVDLDAARADLLAAVHDTLEPAGTWVWLAGGGGPVRPARGG